jgi:hypothetical protein
VTGDHGFAINLTKVAAGNHTFCVTALNVGPALAPDTALGCAPVTVASAATSSRP